MNIPISHYEEITNPYKVEYLFSNQHLIWVGDKLYKVTVITKKEK